MPTVRPPSAKKTPNPPANPALAPKNSSPASKADQKKAKEAYKRGLKAEALPDWQAAFDAYSDAINFDANVPEYGLHQAIAKGHIVEMKIDAA